MYAINMFKVVITLIKCQNPIFTEFDRTSEFKQLREKYVKSRLYFFLIKRKTQGLSKHKLSNKI